MPRRPILLFGLLLIFVIFALQLISSFKTPSSPSQKSSESVSISPSVTKIPISNNKIYRSENYTIEYPRDWINEKFPTTNGESVIFKPANISKEDYYPSLSISIVNSPKSTKEKIFLMFGFQKSTYLINNYIFTKLSGTFPQKIIEGKSIETPVQQTALIIIKDNNEYSIKYQYTGNVQDEKMEKIFTDIISTFDFL